MVYFYLTGIEKMTHSEHCVGEKRKGLLHEIIKGREAPARNDHASQTHRCLTLRERGAQRQQGKRNRESWTRLKML